MNQQPQVVPFPQQQGYTNPNGQYLPAFPALAVSMETFAAKLPWYAWFAIGAIVTYKLFKGGKL